MKLTHLPKDSGQRRELIKILKQKLKQMNQNIKNSESDQRDRESLYEQKEKQTLQLRIKLISDCTELSIARIANLQEIFKHYCTHIFKIGKHMTFERLEYEKVHITLDRFCVFLKDFNLLCAKINGVEHQVIDKNQIVRNFKRISKNCRDLSFQEFITCLEKLAIVYYDEKEVYNEKMEKFRKDRERRILEYKKKMKERERQREREKQLGRSYVEQKQQTKQTTIEKKIMREIENSDKVTGMNFYQDEENAEQNQFQTHTKQYVSNEQSIKQAENDDLLDRLMQDREEINHEQISKSLGPDMENDSQILSPTPKKQPPKDIDSELQLTVQEKIQYYYQLIGVGNAQDFRKKMGELNLPLFKEKPHSKLYYASHKRSISTKNETELMSSVYQEQDKKRLQELREKIHNRKQRDKQIRTNQKISNENYEKMKKQRQIKLNEINRQQSMGINKKEDFYKIQLMDKQLSLNMLNDIKFEDLKYKFDPQKYIANDESDQIFLNEYGSIEGSSRTEKNKQKTKSKLSITNNSTIAQRKRTTSNIVQDAKRRAKEEEVKQTNKEAKLAKYLHEMRKKQRSKLENY